MASKWSIFSSRVISILAENLKNHFPDRIFFYGIWLKLGDHEYIFIPEIKFW